MKYLSVVECPVVFPGENAYGMSSIDMLPRAGVTAGLESRHVRVLDGRIVAVCIWKSASSGQLFFDETWHTRADQLWNDAYQTRFEEIDEPPAA